MKQIGKVAATMTAAAGVAAVTTGPGGALTAVGGAVLGVSVDELTQGALKRWHCRKVQDDENRFARVLLLATQAIYEGDPEIGYANIETELGDPNFKANATRAAVAMRDCPPVDEALLPIAMLVAAYKGRRPDRTQDRLFTFLCRVEGDGLIRLREILGIINNKRRKYPADRMQPARFITPPGQVKGRPARWLSFVPGQTSSSSEFPLDVRIEDASGLDGMLKLLNENGLLSRRIVSGATLDGNHPGTVHWDMEAQAMLSACLGLPLISAPERVLPIDEPLHRAG